MTTIYLVRHGEVAGNSGAVRTLAGMSDLELTPRGVLQAQAVAARMAQVPLDAVYASTLQRAYLTADGIAAAHNLRATRDAGWCEVDYGAWEGLSEAEILADHGELWRARVADPWHVAPPGGESYQMLWARLEPAWERVCAAHQGQNVAVVGHNGSLRVLLCELLGAPSRNARRLQIGNCGVTKICIGASQIEPETGAPGKLEGLPKVIEYINSTSHLEGI